MQMQEKLFDTFQKEKDVTPGTCEKYEKILPGELIEVWIKYGMGSFFNGYLKMIDPEEYQELMIDTYFRGNVAIPIFVTAFGDMICWEENRYIRMIKYKNGVFKGMAAGFDFFFEDLENGIYDKEYFEFSQYHEAVKLWGKIKYDECFGYVPLLGLGGSEKVEHLKKVKIREHIELISQMVGKIGM